MADLLQHLVHPSSQESFHSTRKTVDDPPPSPFPSPHHPSPPAAPSSSAPAPTQDNTTIAALQAAGLSVHDVASYLHDPENERLLAAASRAHKGVNNNNNPPSTNTSTGAGGMGISISPEPVQIGNPKTSHYVTQLTQLCQERALRPAFDFDEPEAQRFGAVVRFGEVVVMPERGETFASKREAKEAVAAKGVQVLKDVPVPGPGGTKGAGPEENWVGKLAEFYAAEPTPTGPIYTDFAIGTHPLYACECTIDKQAPADGPFGGRTLPFPNKKAAKANAAREAVLWLKGNGYMSAEGNKKRKGKVGGMAIVAEAMGGSGKEVSWAARVNELCHPLSLSAPEYRLTPSALAPSMYGGGAWFTRDPLIKSPVGEVRNVFGKKNAKEACAEKVVEFLREVGRKRAGGELGV